MPRTLFLASTPLHVFFSLGLMRGAFRGDAHTLALIDQREGATDYIAEALRMAPAGPVPVVSFPVLGARTSARRVLERITAFTAELAPSTLAVGNDRRIEFYAALRACPSARRIYVDDGLYSYLPHRKAQPAWRERLSDWRRGLKYGVALERPSAVGGSRAVQEAYVLLPQWVHGRLAGKPVRPLEQAWFADAWVRGVCSAAAERAGFGATRCREIALLLLLPHPHFMQTRPELVRRMQALARDHFERGETVALKGHPGAPGRHAHEQLGLPANKVLEVPPSLPVEVLAPLLTGTLVVGTLTTALLSLALLGDRVTVRSLASQTGRGAGQRYEERALEIYASVGILPLVAPTPASACGPVA